MFSSQTGTLLFDDEGPWCAHLSDLCEVLQSPEDPKARHDLKLDIETLKLAGINIAGLGFDTVALMC